MAANKGTKPTTPAPAKEPDPAKGKTPPAPTTDLTKKNGSPSERFTALVMREYQSASGVAFSGFSESMKRLVANYFIVTDLTLARAEAKRVEANKNNRDHKYDNDLPYTWDHVNLPLLAKDLAHYARVGLDMASKNHLFPIPFKDNQNNVYTITLMQGYMGVVYQAEKYAFDTSFVGTVECIYSNDVFKILKRDKNNPIEGYEFTIKDPFKRGDLVGVFGYLEFEDPHKNKLLVFSRADVEKRKQKKASPEFWGGTATRWEGGRKVEVTLEGWEPEMFEKTMIRTLYSEKYIPRDPEKIDQSYLYIRAREAENADEALEAEIDESANGEPLLIPTSEAEEENPDNAKDERPEDVVDEDAAAEDPTQPAAPDEAF